MKTFLLSKPWNARVLFAFLLTVFSVQNIYAYYSDGVYYKVNPYDKYASVTYKDEQYNSYSGTVRILAEVSYNGQKYPVTKIDGRAFKGCTDLTGLTIPNSVTSIGEDAFVGCTGLTELTIPSSVTYIGYSAFYGCTGLTKVIISDLSAWCKISFKNAQSNPLYYANHLYLEDSEITKLDIPNDITEIGSYAFEGCTGLTELTIPNSVTDIGSSAFYGCTGLTELTIGNGVEEIGGSAFYGCTGLTELTIPNNPITRTKIGGSAFADCTRLTELTIEDGAQVLSFSASSAFTNSPIEKLYCGRNISYDSSDSPFNIKTLKTLIVGYGMTKIDDDAFSQCEQLTDLKFAEGINTFAFPPSSNTNKKNPFRNCPIENLYLERPFSFYYNNPDSWAGFQGRAVNDSPFKEKSSLKSVIIGDGISSIQDYAFDGCDLTEVAIGKNFKGSDLGCSSLQKVIITDLSAWCKISFKNAQSNPLYYANHLYLEDSEITKLNIPNDITEIGNYAFNGCVGLKELTMPSSIQEIGYEAFYDCTGLTKVIITDLSAWCKISFKNAQSNPLYYANHLYLGDSEITKLDIPNDITEIGYCAFRGCTSLTELTIGNSVTEIGSSAFEGCTGLTELTIGNSVTDIGSFAFEGCTGLTELTIGNSVTSIGERAFYGCTSLAKLTISDGTEVLSFSNSSSYNKPFADCPIEKLYLGRNISYDYSSSPFKENASLKTLIIGDKVTSIGDYDFQNCTNLKELTISEGTEVLSFPNSAFTNSPIEKLYWGRNISYSSWSFPFSGNTSLKTLIIGDNITEIGSSAFSGCTGLTELTIGSGVTEIGSSAFYGCTGLAELIIPNSVTEIGSSAFYGCTGLAELIIPNSVTEIGSSAFYGCTSLTELTISDGTEVLPFSNPFADCPIEKLYLGRNMSYSSWNSPFKENASLKTLIIGDSVTEIGEVAFRECTSLTELTIPNSVIEIGDYAFKGCI